MSTPAPLEATPELKPVVFMPGSQAAIRAFSDAVRYEIGQALYVAQKGGKSVHAKPLQGFGGASVLEILAIDEGNAFRAVYTVRFAGFVYVLHCFQKKSSTGIKTQSHIIQLIKNRLAEAKEHYEENYADSE